MTTTSHVPERTCVGCRTKAPRSALLRLVMEAMSGEVVVDPRAAMPGRGAWIHPDPHCLDLAERRRALGRALRVTRPIDLAPVRERVGRSTTSPNPSPARVSGPPSEKAGREPMGTR